MSPRLQAPKPPCHQASPLPCFPASPLPRIPASLLPRIPAFLLLIALLACSAMLPAQSTKPYVVMLSLDGFRWDYPNHCPTPNLDRIAANGVKANIQPSFPSKTFPNHYTMATGLYPDHHGIVQNSFYDPETGRRYRISDRTAVEDASFYRGEPVWVTAEKNGVTAASFFWVGSEAPVKGIQPTYWKKYDHGFPFEQRIDTVIHWLSLPEDRRPHLIMWYMDEPDGIGHNEGPNSQATYDMVMYLDSLVGVFLDKMSALPHAHKINVIVTSDHGMCPNSPDKIVRLKDHVDPEWFEEVEGYNPNYTFKVKDEFRETAWSALQGIPNVTVWKHGEVPERLNYGRNPRTLDFILVADSAWQVLYSEKHTRSAGAHGYDIDNTDMHAIFYATGPAFREKYVHPTFQNIHLYPLICEILGIAPAPVDGHIDVVRGMLKD